MNSRHRTGLPRIILVFALLAFCGATSTNGSHAQTPESGIDHELEVKLDGIAHETAALRELPPLESINDVVLTRDEIVAMMPDMVAEELDPVETAALSRALAAIGLIPAGTDLYDLTVRLLGEQVAGFYEPRTDEMFVVANNDFGGAESYYYAHEVVHALQDAYLDPNDLMEEFGDLSSDQELALASLYEGDATSASGDYVNAHPAIAFDMLRDLRRGFPELDAAPAAASLTLVFPYISGAEFVARLRSGGGWDAVNAAYADLPASTEQILHPDKYLDRDQPVLLELPDPTTVLGASWSKAITETLGELQIAVLLTAPPPGTGVNWLTGSIELPEAARNAAAGWDGDRFALWENGVEEVLVWRSVWDTPQDARAFSRALAVFGDKRWGGIFNGESPDDIALVTDQIAARILLQDQEVLYVQAPTLELADVAMAALQRAPAPAIAPGPD